MRLNWTGAIRSPNRQTSTGQRTSERSEPSLPAADVTTSHSRPWWHDAVIYEVYIRSFADRDGDGIGDVTGVISRLPYLADLGVNAIWITPWYPSPLVDGGYDVTDYYGIDPRLGTLAEADELIGEAHRRGIRVILDLVPNHTSSSHRWFREAVASGPDLSRCPSQDEDQGAPRDRYIFRDGRGHDGAQPPNDWQSVFGGPAWTRVDEPDGGLGQWYLHLFDVEQPDLNWCNPEVWREFEEILRFWFDRGVDGFRIDVAHGLFKDPALPDLGPAAAEGRRPPGWPGHPYWDRDEVHEVYRDWRKIAESYGDDRMFVAEAIVANPKRLARYVRPGELHTAFNFDFLTCSWDAGALREVIDASIAALGTVGAPASWVLSSQDEARHVTRYGRAHTGAREVEMQDRPPTDLVLGTRRARAMALLMLGLPGVAYVYQGDELGLWEVEDIPEELLQDPAWERSGHTIRGRDGARVPIPWFGDAPSFGFGPPGSKPWLPQPAEWRRVTVEAQRADPESMLNLYQTALRLRQEDPGFGDDVLHWLDAPEGVLLFERGHGLRCAVNLSRQPFPVPAGSEILVSSAPVDGYLPTDAATWWRP